MEKQKAHDRVIRLLLCCAAVCLLGAALLLILRRSRPAPVFAEFSESGAIKGTSDCYLNELTVLDRYAEKEGNGGKSQLLLVTYADMDDQPVVLSLLAEEGDPLYARLSPYYSETEPSDTLISVSGYFFTGMLARQGSGAEEAFRSDAAAFAEWYAEKYGGTVATSEIVLTFAGETEDAYEEAVRIKTSRLSRLAIVLIAAGVLCAAGIPIRAEVLKRKAAKQERG